MRILTGSLLVLSACATQRAAVPSASSAAPVAEAHAAALPFIENDYAGAVAQARSRGVPVFVDVWAPW